MWDKPTEKAAHVKESGAKSHELQILTMHEDLANSLDYRRGRGPVSNTLTKIFPLLIQGTDDLSTSHQPFYKKL